MDFLPKFVHFADEPLADLASIPLYFVSHLAREHVKVVLSGEGRDEVLAGYDLDALAARLDQLRALERRVPRALLRAGASVLRRSRYGDALDTLARVGWRAALADRGRHITKYWSEAEKSDLWRGPFDAASSTDLIKSWYAAAPSRHPLDQLQQVYCGEWLVEDLLMKADKMSMANSLEVRVPFLDHALVEWAARLPLEWKVGSRRSGYSSKRILRDFARGRVPEAIINRPKQGFPVPAYRWLAGETGAWAADLVLDKQSRLSGYFDVATAKPVVDAARRGDLQAAHKTWILVILEHWLAAWT
jgi:asparagine synthase (glutamine-hydrolysing)